MISNAKVLKNLNNTEVGLPINTTNIYVNNHLTSFNAKLAFFGRKLKNLKKMKNVSTINGKVKFQVPTTQRDDDGHVLYRWRKIMCKEDNSSISTYF